MNELQKKAVLCFWYDAEMNSGGHSGYFECYHDTNPKELYEAILEVSYKEMADNYKEASDIGENDDFEKTDDKYYSFDPPLIECLMEYVEINKEEIFK